MTTRPRRTHRDAISSLAGSAFRRIHKDGRVTFARAIRTLRALSKPTRG